MSGRWVWGGRRKAAVVGILGGMVIVWGLSMGRAHSEEVRGRARLAERDWERIEKNIGVWLDIEKELDTILASQEEILLQLEKAVEEARILKVRANRRRAP